MNSAHYSTVSFHTNLKHSQNATKTGSSKDLCRQTVCSPQCVLLFSLSWCSCSWHRNCWCFKYNFLKYDCDVLSPTKLGEEWWVMMPPADKHRKDTCEVYRAAIRSCSNKRWTSHPCQNHLKPLSSFTSTKTLLCRIQDLFQK